MAPAALTDPHVLAHANAWPFSRREDTDAVVDTQFAPERWIGDRPPLARFR